MVSTHPASTPLHIPTAMSPSPASRHFSMTARTSASIMASSVLSSSLSGILWLPRHRQQMPSQPDRTGHALLGGSGESLVFALEDGGRAAAQMGMMAFQAIMALASSAAGRPGAEVGVAAGEEVHVRVAEARAVLTAQPLGHPDHGDVLDHVHVQTVLKEHGT